MSWQEGEWGRSYSGVCCWVRSQWRGRLVFTISWLRLGGLQKLTEGFDEVVLGGWIPLLPDVGLIILYNVPPNFFFS